MCLKGASVSSSSSIAEFCDIDVEFIDHTHQIRIYLILFKHSKSNLPTLSFSDHLLMAAHSRLDTKQASLLHILDYL